MPVTSTIDRENGITIHTATGNLTFGELAQALESFYRNDDAPENVLWDGRNASLVNLNQDELKRLGAYTKKFKEEGMNVKGGKRAIVAPATVDYGLARMIESFKGLLAQEIKFDVRTFRSYDEAMTWLTGKKKP